MNTIRPCKAALNLLDVIATQAAAIATLGDLLYAVDADSEHLQPHTLNDIGTILEVISGAIQQTSFEARKAVEQAAS